MSQKYLLFDYIVIDNVMGELGEVLIVIQIPM